MSERNPIHSIQFGFCVPIFAYPGGRLFRTANYPRLDVQTSLALAREADALGYDALWVADHLMLGEENAIMEGWTTLAALAGSTQRARLGMIHQAHFFRHPALAAKMGATLDQISGGRYICFSDPAYGKAEHLAYGLPYPETAEERIAATVEGVEIALALWTAEDPVSYQGRTYQVHEATATPKPIQQPHPPIWFGEAHPHTLRACARYGQGWNTVPVTLAECRQRLDALAAACAGMGRSVEEIERSLETQILVVERPQDLRPTLQAMVDLTPNEPVEPALQAYLSGATERLPASLTERYILGTPEQVQARINDYVDLGITHFMFWFMDAPDGTGLRLFAREVAPHMRG